MADFLLAGLVYVPAYLLGKVLADHGFDHYLVGWIAGSTAVLLRWQVPWLRIRDENT